MVPPHHPTAQCSVISCAQDLPGVFSAREFVWWYNGHPAYADLPLDLSTTRSVAIAGLGNVAGGPPLTAGSRFLGTGAGLDAGSGWVHSTRTRLHPLTCIAAPCLPLCPSRLRAGAAAVSGGPGCHRHCQPCRGSAKARVWSVCRSAWEWGRQQTYFPTATTPLSDFSLLG